MGRFHVSARSLDVGDYTDTGDAAKDWKVTGKKLVDGKIQLTRKYADGRERTETLPGDTRIHVGDV